MDPIENFYAWWFVHGLLMPAFAAIAALIIFTALGHALVAWFEARQDNG